MDLGLTGKVAFVTGASKGIGREVARALAEEGCDVVITARGQAELEKTAAALSEQTGRKILAQAGDMSRTEDVERCVQVALDELGRIDVLVTCAGSSPGGLLEELTDEQWMQSLSLKFMGYVRSVRAVVPHMVRQGKGAIVLVVGNDGLKPSFWEMTAGAANAADLNFASSIADQYGPKGIRVNTVNPGPVDTDRWDGLEGLRPRHGRGPGGGAAARRGVHSAGPNHPAGGGRGAGHVPGIRPCRQRARRPRPDRRRAAQAADGALR